MVMDLEYGKRIYDWWGRHRLLYKTASWTVFLGKEKSIRKQAIESIGLKQGDVVLDLACGPGTNFKALEEKVGLEGRIIAFDYSAWMLNSANKKAETKGWKNIEFHKGDAANMELPENSLDGAYSTLAISAISDHKAAIRNTMKALKPGKRFVILDAQKFEEGFGKILNPILKPIFKRTTNWNYDRDTIKDVKETFDKVEVKKFNGGSVFILIITK